MLTSMTTINDNNQHHHIPTPLTIKEVSPTFWNTILERIQRKLAKWKDSLLSHPGKLQLLIASLHGILIYFLYIFRIPRYITNKFEKIQRNFLWSDTEEKEEVSTG